jgi:PAS domain S-box-containing protein
MRGNLMLRVRPTSLAGYSVAALVVAAALLIQLLLSLAVGREITFLLFLLAVMISAWYGGVWPGIAATAMSLFCAVMFLRPSDGELTFLNTADLTRITLFVSEGCIVSLLSEKLRAAWRDSAERGREAAEALRTLRQSEERYHLLRENVRDYAIFIINDAGSIVECGLGVEHIFGYSAAEVVNKPFAIIFAPEDVLEGVPEQVLQKTLAEGRLEDERSYLRRDGTRFQAGGVTTAIRDASGQFRGFAMITRDMTERVEMEAALRRSEVLAAMGRLVASVAHEVRNPLFAISSALDAFEARFGARAEYERYMTHLRTELRRLNVLMEELLTYGRPYKQEFQESSVAHVLEECVSVWLPRAGDAQVGIESQVSGLMPSLPLDRKRLPLVFDNLLKNAISFSPPQSTVVVRAAECVGEDDSRWLDCSVADSGPGFKEADIPLVFEPFFTRRQNGTGLGLAIAQKIVEEHGGQIFAQNRPEGGAVMTVRIPIPTPPSKSEESSHVAE